MAVSTSVKVEDGLFVPFHTEVRGGLYGDKPVGTLYVDAGATGAAGGGSVQAIISMNVLEFGFRLLWLPLSMQLQDNLATPENVQLTYFAVDNRRLSAQVNDNVVMVASAVSTNLGIPGMPVLPIEGVGVGDGNVLRALWDTNTDAKVYHFHAFGPVYDLELMARQGEVSELLAGIR